MFGDEYVRNGRSDEYEKIKPFLFGRPGAGYAAVASEIGISEGALQVRIHRLRRRYVNCPERKLLKRLPVRRPWKFELRYLAEVLARPSST